MAMIVVRCLELSGVNTISQKLRIIMITTLSNHSVAAFPPRIYLDAPIKTEQKNDDILRCEPGDVVDMALGRLQSAGIVLLEWHSLLYHRMNVPVLVGARISISMSVLMVISRISP